MDLTYWHKQTPTEPLFPDLLWSRPENARQAGKLLIVGGNVQAMGASGQAYQYAAKSGAGTVRVLLPSSLQKTVGRVFEAGEYTASTPSGSFAKAALSDLIAMAEWADGVLLAGDFGRNSETAILLEQFAHDYQGQLTLTKDAVDYFTPNPKLIIDRPDTTLVISLAQLQQVIMQSGSTKAVTFKMDLLRLIDILHAFTEQHSISIIVKHLGNLVCAVDGQVSTTKLDGALAVWRLQTAAASAVWWLQNPESTLEALTTAIYETINT